MAPPVDFDQSGQYPIVLSDALLGRRTQEIYTSIRCKHIVLVVRRLIDTIRQSQARFIHRVGVARTETLKQQLITVQPLAL
jgi:hypothetical protein